MRFGKIKTLIVFRNVFNLPIFKMVEEDKNF